MSREVTIFIGFVVFVLGIAAIAGSAQARRCPTACELERRIEVLESSGYWYPYPLDRDEAEQN